MSRKTTHLKRFQKKGSTGCKIDASSGSRIWKGLIHANFASGDFIIYDIHPFSPNEIRQNSLATCYNVFSMSAPYESYSHFWRVFRCFFDW